MSTHGIPIIPNGHDFTGVKLDSVEKYAAARKSLPPDVLRVHTALMIYGRASVQQLCESIHLHDKAVVDLRLAKLIELGLAEPAGERDGEPLFTAITHEVVAKRAQAQLDLL